MRWMIVPGDQIVQTRFLVVLVPRISVWVFLRQGAGLNAYLQSSNMSAGLRAIFSIIHAVSTIGENLGFIKHKKPLEPPSALRAFFLFQPFRMENAFLVNAFVRVGAEVIALRLD